MRKMRKFAEGGSDKYKAKYDRKVADIKSDYDKAMKGKTGKAADVAKAKYEQRMADAKDDLAKWTKSDRTETRAGEKAAERNLSMTRKFGAMQSAVKADNVAKTAPMDDVLKSAPKPQMPSKSEAKPTRRAAPTPAPARSAPVKQQEKPATTTDPRASMRQATAARQREGRIQENRAALRQRTAARLKSPVNAGRSEGFLSRLFDSDANKNFAEAQKRKYGYAEGGTVKKKSTPPQPTPAERAASKRQDEALKKTKPSAADAAAIGRGNRSSGMKKGGSVMKKATKFGAAMKKKSADTMGRAMVKKAGGGKCYAKGGSVSSRADGVAHKGKTKGKMVTMSKGGNY